MRRVNIHPEFAPAQRRIIEARHSKTVAPAVRKMPKLWEQYSNIDNISSQPHAAIPTKTKMRPRPASAAANHQNRGKSFVPPSCPSKKNAAASHHGARRQRSRMLSSRNDTARRAEMKSFSFFSVVSNDVSGE